MSKYTHHDRELKFPIRILIVTVSTSRYNVICSGGKVTDESGDIAEKELRKLRVKEIKRMIIPDDKKSISDILNNYVDNFDLIVFIGGTGLAPSDVTYETIKSYLDKELTAFPILFTLFSYEDIGIAALASRVIAGVKNKTLIYSLPGSKGAVSLAMKKLIIPELGHLINMILEIK